MDFAVVVPTITAATGLVTAISTLVQSRTELRKIRIEAARAGIPTHLGIYPVSVQLAEEVNRLRQDQASRPRDQKSD